jgi:hypothetical protein
LISGGGEAVGVTGSKIDGEVGSEVDGEVGEDGRVLVDPSTSFDSAIEYDR